MESLSWYGVMANAGELIRWALENREALRLKIQESTWIKPFFPELSDVAVEINVWGRSFGGWGTADSKDGALVIALAEAVERAAVQSNLFPTSNGMAAHFTFEEASAGAQRELLERDLFLTQFYTGTPFLEIKDVAKLKPYLPLQNWLRQNGAAISFYQLGTKGAICRIRGTDNQFGLSVGCALKKCVSQSLLSAAIESARRAHHVLSEAASIESLSISEFSAISNPDFSDHGLLAMSPDYASLVDVLFEPKKMKQRPRALTSPLKSSQIEVAEILINDRLFTDCPLRFARATSPLVQNLFLGCPTNENINLARLSRDVSHGFIFDNVTPLPHPLD